MPFLPDLGGFGVGEGQEARPNDIPHVKEACPISPFKGASVVVS